MTDAERSWVWAEEFVAAYQRRVHSPIPDRTWLVEQLARAFAAIGLIEWRVSQAFAAIRADERRKVIEECATLAKDFIGKLQITDEIACSVCEQLAEDIRALR